MYKFYTICSVEGFITIETLIFPGLIVVRISTSKDKLIKFLRVRHNNSTPFFTTYEYFSWSISTDMLKRGKHVMYFDTYVHTPPENRLEISYFVCLLIFPHFFTLCIFTFYCSRLFPMTWKSAAMIDFFILGSTRYFCWRLSSWR